MSKTTQTTLRIDAATDERVNAFCARTGLSKSSFFAMAAVVVLDRLDGADVSVFGTSQPEVTPTSTPEVTPTSPAPFDRQLFLNKNVRATDDDVVIGILEDLADSMAITPLSDDHHTTLLVRRTELQRALNARRTQLAAAQPVT